MRRDGTPRRTGCRRLVPAVLIAGWVSAALHAAPPAPDVPGPDPTRQEVGLPFIRNFSPKEYGASAQNWAVAQDLRGVMYVANAEGVLEFDGGRWRLIQTPKRTTARSLAVDAAGRVYVGAVGEIGYLEPDARGLTQYVSLLESLPPEARDFADVAQTFATPEGIYFQSFARLILVQGTAVRFWNPETSFHLSFRVRDRLFIRERDRGLMELVAGRMQPVPGGDRFAQETIYAMLPWSAATPGASVPDAVLIGSKTQGLFVLDGSSIRPFTTEADVGLKRDLLYRGALMADGSLALGTLQGGVYFVDSGGRLVGRLDKARGLLDDAVYALLLDRQGGLWIGLDRGLARVEVGSPLSRFDERAALDGTVLSLHRHLGQLYAGTATGVFRLEAGPEPRFHPIPGIQAQTWDFASVGDALLVGNNAGVYEVRGTAVALVRESDTPVFALEASRATPGRIFIGLGEGLASMRSEGGRWVDEGMITAVEEVRTLLEMPDGRLWVSTNFKGVLRLTFPGGGGAALGVPRVESFGVAQGLPSMKRDEVYPIGGKAMFASDRGVLRFDEANARFEADPRFASLFPEGSRWVFALADDPAGRIWMLSSNEAGGLIEAGAAVPQEGGSYRWETKALRPFAGSTIESILADDDGVVWFGWSEGLFRYDPRLTRDGSPETTALVRQVSHPGGGSVLFAGGGAPVAPALAYADNALRFEYAAPSFDPVDATRFQVYLEGNDRDWSAWTAEGHREYTNLREGSYRFRVRARDLYGAVSREGVYAFEVRPPWSRTAWAYIVYLMTAGALGWALLRFRVRRVEGEKRALEGTVAERTLELRAKNSQLETLNAIIKSINERVDFDDLLEVMLRECRVIRGVEKAAALVRLPGTSVFTFRAGVGWAAGALEGIELSLAEAEARYTTDAEEVSDDIFLIRGGSGRAAESKLRLHAVPKALLAVRIRIEEQVEGYLVFESQQDEDAFAEHDLDLLRGLKEHFVSAFQKARARAATEEARAKAEDANRAKSVFLANMSHELRTPLNGVLGFAQLMDRAPARSPADRKHLATILRSGEHLLGLINDVLSLSKMEAGRVTLSDAPVDLSALLAGVCDLVRGRAEAKDLWLRTEIGEMPRAVTADGGKLAQILLNLLGNAVKFTAAGGVTLRASWSAGRAVFEVEDTGPGLAPGEVGQLFEAFVQTETGRRSREGTGLGLALSRPLARLMGGDITVQSQAGRGSTFRLEASLPEAAADEAPPERGERRRVEALAPGQGVRRVLVVDDVADNRTLLSGLLASVGFAVAEAADGEEAVHQWREWRPHFIWMDKRMAGVDGLEATRRIREEEQRTGRSRVPIIALSASALEHERAEILASGCDDFVPKPFREGLVFAKLAQHLGLTYVYELADSPGGAEPSVVTAERLALQPAAWVAAMRDALAAGDTGRARTLAQESGIRDAALATDLGRMLASYQLDELEALLTPRAPEA